MSTERVSDEELSVLIERATRRADYKERAALHELQQRRATDRRIAWEAQRELWIQNAYDNNPLKQAISELLP